MSNLFSMVDDKHIPVYRVMWVADVPHFCGEEDCQVEGRYEVRLEQDESVWASREERDQMLTVLEQWWNQAHGMEDDDWE